MKYIKTYLERQEERSSYKKGTVHESLLGTIC